MEPSSATSGNVIPLRMVRVALWVGDPSGLKKQQVPADSSVFTKSQMKANPDKTECLTPSLSSSAYQLAPRAASAVLVQSPAAVDQTRWLSNHWPMTPLQRRL